MAITGFDNLVGCETDYAIQKRNQRQLPDNIADSIADNSADNTMDSTEDNSMDNVHEKVSYDVYGQIRDSDVDKNVDNVHTEKEIRDKSKEKDKFILTVSNETVRQTETVRRIIAAWNELEHYGIRPISRVSSGSKRYIYLIARLGEYGEANVLRAIDNIKGSKFLQGKIGGKKPWVITFDWFVLPSNFPKVLEGNYADDIPQQAEPGCGYDSALFERLENESREDVMKRRGKEGENQNGCFCGGDGSNQKSAFEQRL